MKCCNCLEIDLIPVLTRQGVMVDYCPKCRGIWLDKGEIFAFVANQRYLQWKLEEGLRELKPSPRINPNTQEPFVQIPLLGGKFILDYCPDTGGIWLDHSQLENTIDLKEIGLDFALDKINSLENLPKHENVIFSLLSFRSAEILLAFISYALLLLVFIFFASLGFLSFSYAILVGTILWWLQFFFSPFILDFYLQHFYDLDWGEIDKLPQEVKVFLSEITKKYKLKLPKIGIIEDGGANIFTYGHNGRDYRIIITSALLDLLEPKELKAVISHELAHVVNLDITVMTPAQIIPISLYYLYSRLLPKNKEESLATYRYILAEIIYLLYFLAAFPFLWFLRLREYYADKFAVKELDGNYLVKALIKIGYSLSGKDIGLKERNLNLAAFNSLGIFDYDKARELMILDYKQSILEAKIEDFKRNRQLVFLNPWSFYYQMQSSHPLLAQRMQSLAQETQEISKTSCVEFDLRKPENYYNNFYLDLFIKFLPGLISILSIVLGIANKNFNYISLGLFLFGIAYLVYLSFFYPLVFFPELNISSLFKKVNLSPLKPIPCRVIGTVIAQGNNLGSEFLLQDNTGIIYLDYKKPLKIWSYFFTVLDKDDYLGLKVAVTGWYRKEPIPYLEVYNITTEDRFSKCRVIKIKFFIAILAIILGIILTV